MKSLTSFACNNLVVVVLIFSGFQTNGQNISDHDSITQQSKPNYWKTFRVPIILSAVGLVTLTDNEVFDKWEVNELRERVVPNFKTHVDDYIVVTPAVAVFALDAFGIKAKNNFANRVVLLVKSELIVSAITFPLKNITHEQRPDHTTDDSFPSGHTSHVFMAATFLHHEYGAQHPWISVLGYATATGVGVLRIMNDRHWISDVLVGAGIGVLSTNVAYMTHRYKWGKRKVRSGARVTPYWGRSKGLCITIPIGKTISR
jgi:membrane-associated phospholipid phosphatase